MSTGKYVPRFMRGGATAEKEEPEYVKEFHALSQKVTDGNLEELTARMLKLEILLSPESSNDEELLEDQKDKVRMEPILKCITNKLMANGKTGLRNLKTESRLYSEYILHVKGRTGKVLTRMLIQKFQDALNSYLNNEESDPSDYQVYYCVNIIYFLFLLALNKGGAIPVQVPLRAMHMFMGTETKKFKVFTQSIVRVHSFLKDIELYNENLKKTFLDFLQTSQENKELPKKELFFARDALDYIREGRISSMFTKDGAIAE